MSYSQVATLLLISLLIALPARAQSEDRSSVRFNVEQPPSGALGQDQLKDIAATIRRLERHPMAAGAEQARIRLFKWLQGSPDITISICAGVAGPLMGRDESAARRLALMQYLLSTAAYKIEHLDADEDVVAAKVSGLQGALRVYRATRDSFGPTASSASMERLVQMQEQGTLKQYVEEGLENC